MLSIKLFCYQLRDDLALSLFFLEISGNLLNRITAKSINTQQTFSQYNTDLNTSEADALKETLETIRETVEQRYESFHYYQGIDSILDCLRQVNALIQDEKPWELKKSDLNRLDSVLNLSMDSLRICTILLQPIIPGLCERILSKMNIPLNERTFQYACPMTIYKNHKLNDGKVMFFKRI